MDQLTGPVALVALTAAALPDRLAGDRVDRRQGRHLMTRQDPADGGGDQPELTGQEHRPAAALGAHLQDLCLGLRRDAVRAGVGA
jgi:hypothetical protein